MKQLGIHEYVVTEGELVMVRLVAPQSKGTESEFRLTASLNSEPLDPDENSFQFIASGGGPTYKLLIEFYPITSEDILIRADLNGSDGGDFSVPIEISKGAPQKRYFRFSVAGQRPRFGGGGAGW